jgi:hypothetical protein
VADKCVVSSNNKVLDRFECDVRKIVDALLFKFSIKTEDL